MSLAELHESLEAALTDTVDTTMVPFTIDSMERADWAVRKIAQHRRRLAEAEDLAATYRTIVDDWIADQRARCEQGTSYLEELCARYHRQVLDDDPKAKTVRLPAGELVARKQPDRWDIDDAQFVPWAEAEADRADALLRVKVEVDRAAVKRAFAAHQFADDTRVHDESTGEFVPGVTVTDGEVRFSVKTEVDQ